MATNVEIAEAIIDAFRAEWQRNGRIWWSYGDMAKAVGRPGQHRLLGGPLDEVRRLCMKRGWPDIATVVVTKESLADRSRRPSPKAVEKHGGWPGLRQEQARVAAHDWGSPG